MGGDHVNNFTEEDCSDNSSVKTIRETYKKTNFEFKLFTVAEVEQALEKINPKHSSGWDTGLRPKLLKNMAKGAAVSLTSLYNNCTEQTEYLAQRMEDRWASGHPYLRRRPIGGYKLSPITSLIAVVKIFELLLSNQAISHYDETLYYRMTAYRKNKAAKQTCLCRLRVGNSSLI